MTANGFLNLARFPDDEAGNGRLRRIVDHLILIDGDMQESPQEDKHDDPAGALKPPKWDFRHRGERGKG